MQIPGLLVTVRDTPVPRDPAALAMACSSIPATDMLTVVVDAFQALADPTRTRILYALGNGPLCVGDIALAAGVSESAASHQLRLLRDRRIVKPRREGNLVFYAVDDQHVVALLREAEYHADHVRQGLPDHVPYPVPHHQHPAEKG